jgi:nucleoside-diphosphate-sugar epimerase
LVDGQNILDGELLLKKLQKVDLVIHLAAFISASESWEKPKEYFENNALGTLSVVKNSIKEGVNKIIFFSSAAVKAKPLTPYAVSKIAAEEILNLYKDDINLVIIRPENIYGPGQKANYGYVIHNFIKAATDGTPINIYGDGTQTRDFIYIEDVVDTVDKLLMGRDMESGTVVSLGTGKEININNLAKEVMQILGKKTEIKYLEKRNEPQTSVANLEVAKKLGIKTGSFLDINAGIRKLIGQGQNLL